jgi:TRAP-type C4-dicarboxylate transport system permease small subunit
MTRDSATPGHTGTTALGTAYQLFARIKLAGALLSGSSIFLMMLFIVYNVIARNFFGGAIRGSFEIVQNYFMPLAVFPALGFVYASGILPRMDLLIPNLPGAVRRAVTYLLLAIEIIVFSLMTYFTWQYALAGLARSASFPAAGTLYPLWPLMFLAPAGFTLILIETLFVLLHNLSSGTAALSMRDSAAAE